MLARFMDAISPSGPRVSIRHPDEKKSRSWFIRINVSLWNTCIAPLWSPCYSVTVDTIKASSGDSDLSWSHDLRIELLRYRVIAMLNYVTGSHCNTLIGCVCPSHHSRNDMTSLSTDVIVSMIRKPWSSIAQWASMPELTRDQVVIYTTRVLMFPLNTVLA